MNTNSNPENVARRVAFLTAGGWRTELRDYLAELREAGWTWQKIADECGFSSRQAAEQTYRRLNQ